jgi:GT2 family glycosyltransferase
MYEFAQRKDIGAVGAKLYYSDGSIQHAGLVLGIGGSAGHSHKRSPGSSHGYMGRLNVIQNVSAVTAACMMVRKEVFDEIGGFDEKMPIAFNDVDFCLKIREKGYLIVYTPYAELYHYESKTRGYEDTPEKKARLTVELQYLKKKWKHVLEKGDPYYNPNLTLVREDFNLKL